MNKTNETQTEVRYIAFENDRRIAVGSPPEVALAVKKVVDQGDHGIVLVFDAESSQPVELDLRGSAEEVVGRLTAVPSPDSSGDAQPKRRPGRPKLGVVGREVTLLPSQWDWLNNQPGGASGTLRKLVYKARKAQESGKGEHRALLSAYRFISAIAGNQPGFEEASRALFAGQAEAFHRETESWPADVRDHARALAAEAFSSCAT